MPRPGFLAGPCLVLAALLLAGAAAGQEVLLEPPPAADLSVAPGEALRLDLTASNAGPDGLLVLLDVRAPEGWEASVVPPSFDLPPRGAGEARAFAVALAAPRAAEPGRYAATLELTGANSTTGLAVRQALALNLTVTHRALVMGLFENPLPAPFDNAYGVFLLNLLFWAVVAGLIIVVQDPVVKWLTRKAERHVTARIVHMVRGPMFLALVAYGLTDAWSALPPSGPVEVGRRVFAAVLVLAVMYLAYKAFRAALLYYLENIAARTETQLDDILLPVLEKVGGVVIVAAGFLYLLSTLAIDLTAFVAGGVVVSMVLAFAAQDTLSNFFAGLAILIDRPFAPGEDIMIASGGPLQGDVLRVDHVGLRSTRLYHYRRHEQVVVPNNDLARNPVVNLMHPDLLFRVAIEVSVGYGSDVAKVREILLRAGRESPAAADPERWPPVATLDKFGDSALHFTLLFFVRDVRLRIDAASEARARILEDFRRAGVEIPFPQRVVRVLREEPAPPGGEGRVRDGPERFP